MPMRSLLLAPALLLLTASYAAAQTAIVVRAEQVEQIRQSASASQGARPNAMQPIIVAPPYTINLEHRAGKTGASVHGGEAEIIIVLDGTGTVTTGGGLVDAKTATNGNISGTDIAGGTAQHAQKGDMLMVPQGTAHMMVPDGGPFVLATLHLPRTSEPAPVPGRTPTVPKLAHRAADLPAMIEKAKAVAVTSPRFFGGDTLLALPPYRLGMEYRSPKGVASVHRVDNELMVVLEGEGVIVTGGTVVNPKDTGANVDGDDIAGGTDNHLKKGDWIFVPKRLAHLARTDGTFVLATLHLP
jgi:mannose-6-phosphate isomerase-like protein (cupin superfamily)